jgi:hypothetical protein
MAVRGRAGVSNRERVEEITITPAENEGYMVEVTFKFQSLGSDVKEVHVFETHNRMMQWLDSFLIT